MPDKLHIAHLVNPVSVPIDRSLAETQLLTFESMRRAALEAESVARMDLLSAQYAEDHRVIPPFLQRTPDLDRSVADVHGFSKARKLPILRDLLDRLHTSTAASFLIYTNVDIILHPSFYRTVADRIRSGLDAFIINRRGVAEQYRSVDELNEIFSLRGLSHPGFDCFVFRRSIYEKFRLGRVCVGIPFVGMLLAQNLFCHAKRFMLFDTDVLTYHVGLEVFKRRDPEYLAFNKKEFWQAIETLMPLLDSRKFPWGRRSLVYRMWRWGLHPSIPIRLALRLEPRRWRKMAGVLT